MDKEKYFPRNIYIRIDKNPKNGLPYIRVFCGEDIEPEKEGRIYSKGFIPMTEETREGFLSFSSPVSDLIKKLNEVC